MIDSDKNIAFWDAAAEKSNDKNKNFAGMLMEGHEFEAAYRCRAEQKHILNIYPLTSETRILEVGSGGGRWGFFFADKVCGYIGLDISRKMVEIAESDRIRRDLSNIRFECCDFLEFTCDEKFDLVYFSGVLQYMDDPVVKQCIAKASEILSETGLIISRDTIQTTKRVEKASDYPVIYRTSAEYKEIFESKGYDLKYSALSYEHKRFTGLAAKLYDIPGITYGLAYTFREILCIIDNMLGKPAFLKTPQHKISLGKENPQEHRFFKYVRVR